MGYDMCYRFDSGEAYDKSDLLRRLRDAGAHVLEDANGGPEVQFIGFGIFFSRSEKNIAKGDWLWSRMPPWEEAFADFFAFAERLGCELVDPQVEIPITLENIKEVLAEREVQQRRIAELLGSTVPTKEGPKDH